MNVAVAGALVVRGGQHDEERRRVVAAVVAPERDLAERRHLAVAHLVQDLAGLRVALGVVRRSPACRRETRARRGRMRASSTGTRAP